MSWISDFIKKKVDEGLQNISSGYGNWINGVVENVQSGIQQGIDYVKNSLGTSSGQDTTTPPATTPTTTPTSTPTPPETTPTQTTPTTTPETPSVTTPQATAPVTTPQTSTPTTTEPTTTPESTPPESTPPTSTPEVVTGFDSYEDYLGNNSQNAGNIYSNTVTTLDKQNGETLQQIDETLEKGKEYATDVKETTDKALEDQKTEVYKYIEDTLADTLGYNNEAYGKLVEDITGAMEAGKLQAEEAKKLLMLIADEAKNATYGAAERQREEAERQADINRQRAIADANSAYEQNKAGYGANAEALGNMGLSGGGYSDWINASAYAQNRSEVQGARAQSDAAKREAKYTEDMTKLKADKDYTDKKYQAESDYLYKLGEIDTTYRTNMTEAEQKKLKADQDAKDTARDLKHQADSDYAAGKLKSETEYKGFLYDIETEADKNRLETNQKTELGKLEASNDYIKAIMQNEGELAKFKEALKADDEKAKQVQLSMYEKVFKGVSDGTYTAADAAALADAFEFSQEWKDAIANAATTKAENDAIEKAKADAEEKGNNFAALLIGASKGEYDEATVSALAKQYGLSEEQTTELTKAAKAYATGKTGEMFSSLLLSAAKGEIDENAAKALAAQYGLNEEQTVELTKAAQAYATGETGEMFSSLLLSAYKGEIDENTAIALAKHYGLSPEQTAELTKAAQGNTKEIEDLERSTSLKNIIDMVDDGRIHSEMTDEEIQDLVDSELILPDDVDKVKEKRYTAAKTEVENLIKNGNTAGAIGRVEELVEKGIISKDDDIYQNAYFEVGLYNAQNLSSTESIIKYKNTLDKQKEEGKISEEDYNSLMDYMYKSSAKTIDGNETSISYFYADNGITEFPTIQIGDQIFRDVWLKSEEKADKDLKSVLDYVNNKNGNDNLVLYDGKVYIKSKLYGWCPVNNEDVVKAYTKVVERQPDVSIPKHTPKPKKETTEDQRNYGGSKAGGIAGGDVVNALK